MKKLASCGLFLLTGLLAACGEASDSDSEARALGPEATFAALEERLVSAASVEVDYDITAEGAVQAELQGGLRIRAGGFTEVTATGRFAGQEVDLLLRSDGSRYEFGNGPGRVSDATPLHLNEALLIGLARMGILHNLGMLVGNSPPDGAEGGVREWVVVENFSFDEAAEAREGSQVVTFSMIVGGTPAGSGALELDSRGSPIVRRQTVQFPGGEMRVVERYARVLITP